MSTDVKRYRKKPVVVEAMQFDGSAHSGILVTDWVNQNGGDAEEAAEGRVLLIAIETLEGTMFARRGWWIIKGVQGEFYPCKPDIFAQTYEECDTNES